MIEIAELDRKTAEDMAIEQLTELYNEANLKVELIGNVIMWLFITQVNFIKRGLKF